VASVGHVEGLTGSFCVRRSSSVVPMSSKTQMERQSKRGKERDEA
jgi:hypothetical protein